MKNILIAVVALIVIVTGVSLLGSKKTETTDINTQNINNEQVENKETNNQPVIETNTQINNAEVNTLVGEYKKFDGNITQYEGKDIVLFFKADWCPSCRIVDTDIKSKLDKIPAEVVILELNYDKETELKKKYGVTTQHTFVQIDKEGNLIKKWSGGGKLEDLLNQVQ